MSTSRPMVLARLLPWVLGCSLMCPLASVTSAQTASPGGAGGASTLPSSLLELEGGASSEQQRQVREFVAGHFAVLSGGDLQEVVDARDALLTAMRAGNENFRLVISREVLDQIDPLLASELVLVRLNSVMLLQSTQEPASLPKTMTLLSDANAGVQFASASALQSLLAVQGVGPADQSAAQAALEQLARSGASDPLVVERCLLAILTTVGDAGVTRVLNILGDRLALHEADASLSYQPEARLLQQMLLLAGRDNPEPLRRQITVIAAKYHLIGLMTLQQRGSFVNAEQGVLKTLITLTDALLSAFSDPPLPQASHPSPRTIDRLVEAGDWDTLLQRARQWVERLQSVGFSAQELSVQPPAGS